MVHVRQGTMRLLLLNSKGPVLVPDSLPLCGMRLSLTGLAGRLVGGSRPCQQQGHQHNMHVRLCSDLSGARVKKEYALKWGKPLECPAQSPNYPCHAQPCT
jgi:hypothetical protein